MAKGSMPGGSMAVDEAEGHTPAAAAALEGAAGGRTRGWNMHVLWLHLKGTLRAKQVFFLSFTTSFLPAGNQQAASGRAGRQATCECISRCTQAGWGDAVCGCARAETSSSTTTTTQAAPAASQRAPRLGAATGARSPFCCPCCRLPPRCCHRQSCTPSRASSAAMASAPRLRLAISKGQGEVPSGTAVSCSGVISVEGLMPSACSHFCLLALPTCRQAGRPHPSRQQEGSRQHCRHLTNYPFAGSLARDSGATAGQRQRAQKLRISDVYTPPPTSARLTKRVTCEPAPRSALR